MAYLYGDATPFPLDENFIETLSALVDACVELFGVAASEVARKDTIRNAQQTAQTHIQELDVVASEISTALKPFASDANTPPARAANTILEHARGVIASAAKAVATVRDQAVQTTLGVSATDETRRACEPFFTSFALPYTTWTITWSARTETAAASAIGIADPGIEVECELTIAGDSKWAHPIPVHEVAGEVFIHVPKEPSLLSKSTSRRETLQKMVVTGLSNAHGDRWLIVRPTSKKPNAGYKFAFGESGISWVEVDPADAPIGSARTLDSESEAHIVRLWEHALSGVHALAVSRKSLARVGTDESTHVDDPARLAESMLESVAKLVREMRKRSRVPGELALKRDLGDGRREELFVPRDELIRKFASLQDGYRRSFEAIGLSNESTADFTVAMLPRAATSAGALDQAISADIDDHPAIESETVRLGSTLGDEVDEYEGPIMTIEAEEPSDP